MFRGSIALYSVFFVLIAGSILKFHLVPSEEVVCDGAKSNALEARQVRSQVSKDFWVSGSAGRTRATIGGIESTLNLVMRGGKIEGVERLVNVDSKTSQGHHFTANEGIYFYPSNHFWAINATLECEGLLKGRAQKIEMSLTGSHLLCSGGVELDAQKERLHVAAETGSVVFGKELLLSEMHCQGSVQLKRDDTFALAKQFDYFAEKDLAILSCPLPERVLFWQQSARLSAPEVRMKLDSGKVEGLGDVHCSFDLEEQNLFDAIFAKYL